MDLSDLCQALPDQDGSFRLAASSRLRIAVSPSPFVPPPLIVQSAPDEAAADAFAAEVIVVSSPAAVGKSTAANHLSATRGLPLLDLAEVRVSTRTLDGLLAADFADPRAAVAEWSRGGLPIIIDALDEGRLRSGDANFEAFLETAWELLLKDRSTTNKPKLILFGRDLASETVEMLLELAGGDITSAWVRLGFFDADSAREVINAHAEATAKRRHEEWSRSQPSDEVVKAFFQAIASALGVSRQDLWGDQAGEALCGYAPVLAAIGSLLAQESNPVRLRNALSEAGVARAWAVIERVAGEILDRERNEKLVPQLENELGHEVPSATYDREEQLAYLVQRACGKAIEVSRRVTLSAGDLQAYRRMIDQQLDEHPFLQAGELTNAVLGSLVYAHGVSRALIDEGDIRNLRQWSRQPFLWRSLESQAELEEPEPLFGSYIGAVLNSLWNDPGLSEPSVRVAHCDDEDLTLKVEARQGDEWTIPVLPPVELYEQVREFTYEGPGDLRLEGFQEVGGTASFYFFHNVDLAVDGQLEVNASSVVLDGDVRIYAAAVSQPGGLSIAASSRARQWFGGQLGDTVPWRDYAATLEPLVEVLAPTEFERFLSVCAQRMPTSAPLVVFERSFIPGDHQKMRWLERDPSGDKFPGLLRLLVEHNLARADGFGASGSEPKVRLHFSTSWVELRAAAKRSGDFGTDVQHFVEKAQALFEG